MHCIRLNGRHTYDVVYDSFDDAITKYDLNSKLHKVITDGGSNMVNAFNDKSQLNLKNQIITIDDDAIHEFEDDNSVSSLDEVSKVS